MARKRKPRPDLAERNRLNARHGMTRTTVHNVWCGMRDRCFKPEGKDYQNYGGRGITVCERWLTFENFLEDMGIPPKGHSIDRIDNDGNYEPGNCRWAPIVVQARNRRTNVLITAFGKTKTVAEWSEVCGLERKTLEYRIRVGWDAERAISTPPLISRKA